MPLTRRTPVVATGLPLYDRAAQASSATVIRQYSTSFGLAVRLLQRDVRGDVRSIYALVRVADEIVDGAAEGAGLDLDVQRALLDDLEQETALALERGFSSNLVVHAFARTARRTGIDARLTGPFFASMRRDLDAEPFTADSIAEYIYGSAEVVGLMCLRAFLHSAGDEGDLALDDGARRLGAAFQKINFLRDLGSDTATLGRNYFPGVDLGCLTEAQKLAILDDIDADLAAAARALPALPDGCRAAVTMAHRLFARLASRMRAMPAEALLTHRAHVPTVEKCAILVTASLGSRSRRA